MNFKKGFLILGIGLSTVILAACGKSTPNLNFEETLEAYNKSNAALMQMMTMVSNQDSILESVFNGTLSINADKKGSGKLLIDSKNVVENKTHNAEGEVNLTLDANSNDETSPFTGNINAKLGIKSLIKDLQMYLQLSNLDVKSDNKEVEQQLEFVLAMASGFKNKWISIDLPEIKNLIKMNQSNFNLPESIELGTKAEYYLNPTSTTYEGQPAWKVDLNEEVIKAEAKKVLSELYGEMNAEEMLTGEELKDFLAQKETAIQEVNTTVDQMKFENVDAYFVIYPEDVKFILKNADITIKEVKINVSQSVTETEDKGIITVTPLNQEDKKVEISYEIKKEGEKKYSFTAEFKTPENPEVKIEGKLAYELEDKSFIIKPDVKVSFEDVVLQFQGNYSSKNLETYTFNAPENAESIQSLFGGMFGGIDQTSELSLEDQEVSENSHTGSNN